MEGFKKYLNIADEIDIMIFKENNQSLTLPSFVYEVKDDQTIIISNPIKNGVNYPLEKSYVYYFRFYIENSGMYLFKGIMVERIKFDNLPSVIIQLESDIKRVQRRKFYRVNLFSVGNFLIEKKLSEDEIKRQRNKMMKKYANESDIIIEDTVFDKIPFDTKDLSGGGLRVLSNYEAKLGDIVKGEFKIIESWVIFNGEITRIEKKDDNRYELGIKFLELDSSTQSKIVAYVFEVERNLIKKGLM